MRSRARWLVVLAQLACNEPHDGSDGSSRTGETSVRTSTAEVARTHEDDDRFGTTRPKADLGPDRSRPDVNDRGDLPSTIDAPPESPSREVTPEPPQDVTLQASDGTELHGRYYGLSGGSISPVILLFHQAGSNAAEYGPIAPRLQALGFAALAIDQRSGGRKFGRDNLTVKARGSSAGYGAAYRDLEAALAWARQRGHARVIACGSSYSAALVFRLAAEHPGELSAVLAFSPGEYFGREGTVAAWAKQAGVPVFVSSARGKEIAAAEALVKAVGEGAVQHVPVRAVHGASMLREDRNPTGYEGVWGALEGFLMRVKEGER